MVHPLSGRLTPVCDLTPMCVNKDQKHLTPWRLRSYAATFYDVQILYYHMSRVALLMVVMLITHLLQINWEDLLGMKFSKKSMRLDFYVDFGREYGVCLMLWFSSVLTSHF